MPPWKDSIEAMLMILPPRPAPIHAAADRLGQEEGGLQVDVHHLVPVLLGEVERVGAADDAGVVDQDVDAAERLHAAGTRRRAIGSVRGQVGLDRQEAAARAPATCALGLGRRRAADGDDVGAGLRQRDGDALAEAGVGAGDEGDLAGEIEEVGALAGSFQLADVEHVHVGVVEVLAAHRPDEGVVAGARAHVDRPGRRHHRLVVRPSRCGACRSGSPMKWKTRSFVAEVEVEIDLGAAVMQVRRHGVPDAAGLEDRQAQQQLAGLAGGRHDELVDGALVRRLQRAALQRHGLVDARSAWSRSAHAPASRRGRTSRAGRIARTRTPRPSLPIGDVEAVARRQRVRAAVDGDRPAPVADIDHAQLAPLQERLARRRRRLGLIGQRDRSRFTGAAPPTTKRSLWE